MAKRSAIKLMAELEKLFKKNNLFSHVYVTEVTDHRMDSTFFNKFTVKITAHLLEEHKNAEISLEIR